MEGPDYIRTCLRHIFNQIRIPQNHSAINHIEYVRGGAKELHIFFLKNSLNDYHAQPCLESLSL